MTDQDSDVDEQDSDVEETEDDNQYGGSTQDIDAVEQTEKRDDAVETDDGESDGEGEGSEKTDDENA